MTNWIKNHATSMTSPINPHIRLSLVEMKAELSNMFNGSPGYTPEAISAEVDRLVATGQLVTRDGIMRLGKVIFEEAVPVTEQAVSAVDEIIRNLSDRRGIRHEIDSLDEDVQLELKNTLAAIIDKHVKVSA